MPSLVDKSGKIDYFGQLTSGNFVDWLITFCLGSIIVLFTISLGGARADTHVVLLPLFVLLLVLHGIWLAVDDQDGRRVSQVPLLFIPFLAWGFVSVHWFSPTPWLGRIELIYAIEAFIIFWVLVNNLRTRAHLWVMIVMVLSPGAYAILIGFYQFFQNPNKIADPLADHGIMLSSNYWGQATGSFADPNSFATFLLVLLPSLLIATAVPRLPMVFRVFCAYVSLMLIFTLALTQLFWPIFVLIPVILLVSFVCFQKLRHRILLPLAGIGSLLVVVALMTWLHPKFSSSFERALSPSGEGVRFELWEGALGLFSSSPVVGVGAGAFSLTFAQSPDIHFGFEAQTPHSDFLLLLTQYGVIGFLLCMLPVLWVVWMSLKRWRAEPSRVKLKDRKGAIMPPQRFFLSLGLSSFVVFLICASCSFVFAVPALMFYGIFFFSILVKSSLSRTLKIPRFNAIRWVYAFGGGILGFVFFANAWPRLEAHAIELQMRQRMDHLIDQQVHISGNESLLKRVIYGFEDARLMDPTNVDVLLGLSAAQCQRYFQNPAEHDRIGNVAVGMAKRATELSDGYALAWAQLGVAYALSGDLELAETALRRALELAPNSSNIHYYWASYLSHHPERRLDALRSVNHALNLNPKNAAARQLQQKLLIL